VSTLEVRNRCCLSVHRVEHVPSGGVRNKGRNACLIAYPIVCSISISVVLNHEIIEGSNSEAEVIVFHQRNPRATRFGVFDHNLPSDAVDGFDAHRGFPSFALQSYHGIGASAPIPGGS
jgi:hypothetical protein